MTDLHLVGYLRVSTIEQAEGGHSLQQQHQQITRACEANEWALHSMFEERGQTAGTLDRPELHEALKAIIDGHAEGLIVSKLDRLSRSVVDFGRLLEWFEQADARLIALDMNVDTGTPAGRLVANVMAAVAEWELSTIRERTRNGLRLLREQGKPVGLPAVRDRPELQQRIRELRADGASYRQICEVFNAEGVPTVRGGVLWRPSALQTLLGGPSPRRRRLVQLPEVKR